jgi:transcriptional antiterminator NusG
MMGEAEEFAAAEPRDEEARRAEAVEAPPAARPPDDEVSKVAEEATASGEGEIGGGGEEAPDMGSASDEGEPAPAAEVAQAAPVAAAAVAGREAEAGPTEEADDGRRWYVVHCYSGYEAKVRHNLEQRVETMGMKGKIFDVVIPTEEEIEVKDGKRRTVERHVFPGYILVQMQMDEDSWYVVRNTPGVTGFVGMGNEPTPLRPEEVQQIIRRMEAEAPRVKVTYKAGQRVRIVDGPFNDFIGTVDEIDMERAKVRVMVSFFGRETPVELDFLQVEKA